MTSRTPSTPPPRETGRPGRPSVPAILLLVLLGFAIGRACDSEPPAVGPTASEEAPASTVWTCSMHPHIRLPGPGSCPICFMDLIPLEDGQGDGLTPGELALSEQAVALAGIRTTPVATRVVSRPLRLFGRVSHDETRVETITAWIAGRLDKLFVDYVGADVRAGDHLGEIYSPNLLTTQRELLQAVEAVNRHLEAGEEVPTRQQAALDVARERMRLWGLKDEQIAEIETQDEPSTHITIHSQTGGTVVEKPVVEGTYVSTGDHIYTIADLSQVWLLLDAYEPDLPWIRYGQHVTFELDAYPGEVHHGSIAFIAPVLDETTRTVRVRVNVENRGGRLRPGMFVRATVQAELGDGGKIIEPDLADQWMCPMHPEVRSDGAADCPLCGMALVPAVELDFRPAAPVGPALVIPATAPLLTGKRAVVFVRVADREQPTFAIREVVLGPRAGDVYVVKEGLSAGEEVVTHGAFKIDAELQLRGRPSMMSADREPEVGRLSAPEGFRAALAGLQHAYLRVRAELAADTMPTAVAVRLEDVPRVGLSAAAEEVWEAHRAAAAGALERLGAASDLGEARRALDALTAPIVAWTRAFGYPDADGAPGWGVYHCPMAFDDRGADWIQPLGDVANPYLGASMLRCGDLERELRPHAAVEDDRADAETPTAPAAGPAGHGGH